MLDIIRNISVFLLAFIKSKALLVVIIVVLSYQLIIARLEVWDARGVKDFVVSYSGFMRELSAGTCITRERLLYVASTKGWKVDLDGFADGWHVKEDGISSAVRVYVRPPVPFSKEPGIFMAFDESGCLVPK